jgi:hypothetical protein
MLTHFCVELLVLAEEVHTQVGQPDEVFQLAGRRDYHLAHHVFCMGERGT